jgi:hypothetical protein
MAVHYWTTEEVDALTDRGAMMTTRQFAALERRLDRDIVLAELTALCQQGALPVGRAYDEAKVAGWLRNGWNTEKLLRQTHSMFAGRERAYALQWAFPQAYYSTYAVALGFFGVRGHTESQHAAVIKCIGRMMQRGEYPKSLSFLAAGGRQAITFLNITKVPAKSTLTFNPDDPVSVDTQIAQFLSGTRNEDLARKRATMTFKTARGKPKKSLSRADWSRVSEAVGLTNLVSLLYRKRIKANYGEIDTYLSVQLDADAVFRGLSRVVACLNLVHECFIIHALARPHANALMNAAGAGEYAFVAERRDLIHGAV